MVSINSALAVDLTGQVAADTLQGKFFSGIGGQVDFVRGAARSRGGKAIIALPLDGEGRHREPHPAGARGGRRRGHQPRRRALRGHRVRRRRPLGQEHPRARHGAHRDRAPRLPRRAPRGAPSSVATSSPTRSFRTRIVPWRESRSTRRSATAPTVLVRPLRMTDEEPLQRLFYELSDESTYRRFCLHHEGAPARGDAALVEPRLRAEHGPGRLAPGRATSSSRMARYDVDPATRLAEIAFVVRDDWQRRGVGTLLMRRMAEIARARGLAGFRADVLGQQHGDARGVPPQRPRGPQRSMAACTTSRPTSTARGTLLCRVRA